MLVSAKKGHPSISTELDGKRLTYIWNQCGNLIKQSIRNLLEEEISIQDSYHINLIEKHLKHIADDLPLHCELILLKQIHQKYQEQMKAFNQCDKLLRKIKDKRRRYLMTFAELNHDENMSECVPLITSCQSSIAQTIGKQISNLESRNKYLIYALSEYQRYLSSSNANAVFEHQKSNICSICSHHQISHATQCGHLMCEVCLTNTYEAHGRQSLVGLSCPFCQTQVESLIRIYF
jgi:hypothetical protein